MRNGTGNLVVHPGQRLHAPHILSAEAEEHKREMYQRFRRGESIDSLSRRYDISPSTVRRAIAHIRYLRIQAALLDFIPNDQFKKIRGAEEERTVGPPPAPARPPKRIRPPSGLPPYLASLYEVPLLTAEQERHQFRRMNFLKYTASRLREKLDPQAPSCPLMDEIEHLYQQSVAVKNEIIRANLRLVVAIAKRYATSTDTLFELVSDGNISLIRAVEKFDFGRGFKFSTYATWALIKNFARTIPNEHRYRTRFHTGGEEMFQSAEDVRSDQIALELAQSQAEHQVGRIMDRLDDREQQIIRYRYGLGPNGEPMTLKQVGTAMGVTKERIRQLETRAMAKLRKAAEEEGVDVPEPR